MHAFVRHLVVEPKFGPDNGWKKKTFFFLTWKAMCSANYCFKHSDPTQWIYHDHWNTFKWNTFLLLVFWKQTQQLTRSLVSCLPYQFEFIWYLKKILETRVLWLTVSDQKNFAKFFFFDRYSKYHHSIKGRTRLKLNNLKIITRKIEAFSEFFSMLQTTGCSSLLALFYENGPYFLNNKTLEMEINPYSWNSFANIIFLDQPVGVSESQLTVLPKKYL